jgi:hypothetical protein
MPTYGRFEVEHIIPPKKWADYIAGRIPGLAPIAGRKGPDHADNYAWACRLCNVRKRQHLSHRVGRRIVRLFDPRRDEWRQHFALWRDVCILGRTPIGVATEQRLGFQGGGMNGPLVVRVAMRLDGLYPPSWIEAG